MGDDHFPRLERVIAPRIGPAASERTSVVVCGATVPAEGTLCLDLSAARSAYGRRTGKNAHTTAEDLHEVMKLPDDCDSTRALELLGQFAPWLKVEALCSDAHSPAAFPFRCKRRGCGAVIKDAAEREKLRKELAELKADKTVTGKKVYAGAIAKHADLHGQQMPFERPVTDIPTTEKSILDLLHALDLNLPKVDMKYSIIDPVILDADMRLQIGDFLSEIGCSLDVQEKEKRDPNRKWFHGSVWHYDFVCGANKKSHGLHVNIFQLCLIVYGMKTTAPPSVSSPPASAPRTGAKRKEAPTAIVDDWSDDDEDDDEGEDEEGEADLEADEIMTELRAFFGANAE
mmetsp:Transcript_14867/g.39759  ORF Transcript_14867/g.39759 Transcript_14867/m.39759 type:complete len:344 (+) Transcript_14867:621-1652(+)